jgi:hypothetical protein
MKQVRRAQLANSKVAQPPPTTTVVQPVILSMPAFTQPQFLFANTLDPYSQPFQAIPTAVPLLPNKVSLPPAFTLQPKIALQPQTLAYPIRTTVAAPMPTPMATTATQPSKASGIENNNLFIYHLPPSADEQLLMKLFSQFGTILSTKVIRDQGTGQCKGYGFVQMANFNCAVAAMQALQGLKIENRHLSISFKK